MAEMLKDRTNEEEEGNDANDACSKYGPTIMLL